MTLRPSLIGMAAILVMSLASGCAKYDYLQRTDRISYRAGNAVHANLERQTINPSSAWMYDTFGLGANGSVLPAETQASTASPTGANAPPGSPPSP